MYVGTKTRTGEATDDINGFHVDESDTRPQLSISSIYCPADANNAENQTYDFFFYLPQLKNLVSEKDNISLVPCCTTA